MSFLSKMSVCCCLCTKEKRAIIVSVRNTLNINCLRQKQRVSLFLGSARAPPAFARTQRRKKERQNARASFFRWLFLGNARALVSQRSAAFGKNKRDIAGMSAGRTDDIDTKRSEKKARRHAKRERAPKRGGRLRLTSVPFLSMSSSHEREERSRSNLSSRCT